MVRFFVWWLANNFFKLLECVRNIYSSTKKCTNQGGNYDAKLKTQEKCNTFSCVKKFENYKSVFVSLLRNSIKSFSTKTDIKNFEKRFSKIIRSSKRQTKFRSVASVLLTAKFVATVQRENSQRPFFFSSFADVFVGTNVLDAIWN